MPKPDKTTNRMNTNKLINEAIEVRQPGYFFGDYLDENSKLKIELPYRAGLSAGRTAMNTLAICHMLQKGYELKDILDPMKLEAERQQAGREIYDMYHKMPDSEFNHVFAQYLVSSLDRVMEEINEEMAGLHEITGNELAKPEHAHIFKALFFMQDLGQEILRDGIKEAAYEIHGKEKVRELLQKQTGGNYFLDAMYKAQTEGYKMTQGRAGIGTSEQIQNEPAFQMALMNSVIPCIQNGYIEELLKDRRSKSGNLQIYGDFMPDSPEVEKLTGIQVYVGGGSEIREDIEGFLELDYVGNLIKMGNAIEDGIFDSSNIRFDERGHVIIDGLRDNISRLINGQETYNYSVEGKDMVDKVLSELALMRVPDGQIRFRTGEYQLTGQSVNLPDDIQGSGNVRELAAFYIENKNILTEDEKNFLADRIFNNMKLEDIPRRIKQGDIDVRPRIVKADNTYSFPGVTLDGEQTTLNGCWSCSIELLLKSRGVELEQREIREYRSGISRENYKKAGAKDQLLKDAGTGIEENADIIINVLPNTGVFTREVMGGEFEEKKSLVARTLKEAFADNSSPLSINIGGHYITVTGLDMTGPEEEWKVSYLDSADYPDKQHIFTVDRFTQLLQGEQFSMSYLVNINNQDDLNKISNESLRERIQLGDDNELVPMEGDKKPDPLNGPCTGGLTFNNLEVRENGTMVKEAIYMPKSIDPSIPAKYSQKNVDDREIKRNHAYLEEFKRLVNDMKNTNGVFTNDSPSYRTLQKTLEDSLDKIKKSDPARFSDTFSECMKKIGFASERYKKEHMNLKKLGDRRIRRIKTMNRLECLKYDYVRGVEDPSKDLDRKIAEKTIQAAIIKGIDGPDHDKFMAAFLKSKTIYDASLKLAKNEKFMRAEGMPKTYEDKMKLLKTNGQKYLEALERKFGPGISKAIIKTGSVKKTKEPVVKQSTEAINMH